MTLALSKYFLFLLTFILINPTAFACGDYAKKYQCTSKIIKQAILSIHKEQTDNFGFYKFELSVGPFFNKEYYFIDDNQWVTFDKTNVKATFTSKTRCENSTLISETYTDYPRWSKRIYDDIEIIQNTDGSLTINTKYWTEKPNEAPTKKPYTWNCKIKA